MSEWRPVFGSMVKTSDGVVGVIIDVAPHAEQRNVWVASPGEDGFYCAEQLSQAEESDKYALPAHFGGKFLRNGKRYVALEQRESDYYAVCEGSYGTAVRVPAPNEWGW